MSLSVGGMTAVLRDLCRELSDGEVPPAELTKDLDLLPEVGERGRGLLPPVVERSTKPFAYTRTRSGFAQLTRQ